MVSPLEQVQPETAAALPRRDEDKARDVPLCVDLDGTLIRSDLLWESMALLLRRSPAAAMRLPWWLFKGKAGFKGEVARQVALDATTLPYRADVVAFLTQQRASGRRIILTTASHETLAAAVAEHLHLFDEVLASDGVTNLSGRRKLAAIEARWGREGFDYVGDSHADVPLLKAARQAYVAAPARGVVRKIGGAYDPARRFGGSGGRLKAWLKALRPVQWSKNLLIFVPLMTAHKVQDLHLLWQAAGAFAVFCLVASAVYLLNDLVDIDADRQHPRKRRRPLASGDLSIPAAFITCGLLAGASVALSVWALPPIFLVALGTYLFSTTLYSLWLKRKLLLDVIVLAGLYTLRIIGGGAATGVEISQWLLAFSMFFFLSLAFVKRYSELLIMQERYQRESRGRSYLTDDIALIETVGPASGYMAVLVFGLYISQSDAVKSLYPHPTLLWGICPILLYWITRMWFLARRRQFADDPIAFALRDRVSLAAGVLTFLVALVASRPWHW